MNRTKFYKIARKHFPEATGGKLSHILLYYNMIFNNEKVTEFYNEIRRNLEF